jgi:phosphatidylglycerol:prolipoprotein diacylglycerol transferase
MHPILFHVGRFDVPAYGVISALGMLAGPAVFGLLAQRLGHHRGKAFEAALEAILVGFLASKLVGIAFQPGLGTTPFLKLLANTGGVWYVGFLSGVAYATWRFRGLGMPLRQALDCAAVGVATGHAFGRIACFFAGCCWGGPCDAPWAVTFTSERAHQLVGVPLNVPLHPVQLYEAGSEILTALLLGTIIWRRAYRFHLQPGLLYLIIYGCVRFGLELLRDDPRGDAGLLTPSQAIALAIVCVALPLYVLGMVRGTIVPWWPRVPGGDARADLGAG